jgi:hypothetical protein
MHESPGSVRSGQGGRGRAASEVEVDRLQDRERGGADATSTSAAASQATATGCRGGPGEFWCSGELLGRQIVGVGASDDCVRDGVLRLVQHGDGELHRVHRVLLRLIGAVFGTFDIALRATLVEAGM